MGRKIFFFYKKILNYYSNATLIFFIYKSIQKEYYQALHDYWVNGKAERKTTADDRTGFS